MKIEGTHKCDSNYKNCSHEYEWMVVLPNQMSDRLYDVEVLNKPQGRIIDQDDNYYTIKTMCPNCIQDNVFEVKKHS